MPLEPSKNVLYFSSTLSCHIIQQLRLVVSYLIIDHGILRSSFIFMDQECRCMTIFEIMHVEWPPWSLRFEDRECRYCQYAVL